MAAAPVVTHFSQCTQNFFRKRISSKVISHPPVQSIKVRSQMMPPEVKKYLSRNIQSQFDKDPAIQSGEVKKWLLSGNQPLVFSSYLPSYFTKFNIQGQFWTQNYMRIPKLVLLLIFEQILMEKIRFKVIEGEIRSATLYFKIFPISSCRSQHHRTTRCLLLSSLVLDF